MGGYIPWHNVDLPLRSARSIWLSTTRPDGRPHAVPVWFLWDGTDLYFTTGRHTQKAKNLSQQPWVIVHAGDGDDVIILEGKAEIVRDGATLHRVNGAYMEKYVDPHSGARATIFGEHDDLYRVAIKHVLTWAYGTVSSRTDWYFD